MKISTRFLAIVLAISFISMCLLTTVSSVLSGTTILTEGKKKLQASVAQEATYMDGWLKSQLALVSTLAVDLADQPNLDPERLLPVLKMHTNSNAEIFDVYYGVPNGIVTFSSGYQPPYHQGWASYKRPWYIAAMKDASKAVFTDLYADVQTGDLCLTAAKSVIKNGEVIGVAASDMLIDQITKQVTNITVEDSEFSFLTDRDGNVLILSNDPQYIGNGEGKFEHLDDINGGIFQGIWQETSEGGQTEMEISDGIKRLFVCSIVETNGWHLYAAVPSTSLTTPIMRLITTLVIISVVTLALTAAIMTFMIKKSITQPIRHVTYAALELSRGNTEEFFETDITQGALDSNQNRELKEAGENLQSGNEIDIMFSSLKVMLSQLNEAQRFKLEAVEAQHEKEKAEASARSKSDFLARMSHEIRTPMNAIIGMTELALREDMSPIACEHVMTIKHAGANLLSIINDILDFSKIETGKLEIVPVHYTFSSLLNDVISIIRMRVIDSQVRFAVYIDSSIPNNLYGDESRIRQILLNLLSNAVKYTERGVVYLTVDAERANENTVLLKASVLDTGKGIKKEDLGKLFSDFVQLDLVRNKGIEGTGLGLAITRNLIQSMNGDINVSSEYGRGSIFKIALPQKYTSQDRLAFVKNPEEKSVLVYERRDIYAVSIKRSLENLGVSSTLVSNDGELCEKMAIYSYSFIFISSTLFEKSKDVVLRFGGNIKIVLLIEFGEAIADKSLSILAMPVYALSIANILNSVSDSFQYSANEERIVRFMAPEAKILIVDDIKTNLKIAEGLLQPYKMQLDLCTSGIGAIKAVKIKKYDLVFMDYMMPGIDGVEATRRIRALAAENPYYRELPIVALTADAISGTEEMFLQNGFNDFLSKPIDTVKLNTILEKWIAKRKKKEPSGTETSQAKGADTKGPVSAAASANRSHMRLPQDFPETGSPEAPESSGIKIEGLNTAEGIAMTGGTLSNYLQTLAIFYEDGLEKIEEIKQCLEDNDLSLYITNVHALKSASASIGARDLSAAAKALELAGKQGNGTYIREHNAAFLADLTMILSHIGRAIAASGPTAKQETAEGLVLPEELEPPEKTDQSGRTDQPAQMSDDELKEVLALLKSALMNFESGMIDDGVSRLRGFTQRADVRADIERLLKDIFIGDFDEAMILIEVLLQGKDR